MIGLSASLLLWTHGRVAGIAGVWAGLVIPTRGEISWRAQFVLGLALGGLILLAAHPGAIAGPPGRSTGALLAAGILVGVGTRMGGGCTSGHGVCGLSRLSARSLAAVATFMTVGFAVATSIGALLGGRL